MDVFPKDDTDVEDIDEIEIVDATSCIILAQMCDGLLPDETDSSNRISPKKLEMEDEYLDLAIALKHGDETVAYTEEKQKFIHNSSRLSPSYTRDKNSVERRFFNTIEEFGSPRLKTLLEFVFDGLSPIRCYNIPRTVSTASKILRVHSIMLININ